MGHIIEQIALSRGHSIVACIDAHNVDSIDTPEFAQADVAIEFTMPSAAYDNCRRALDAGVPVVSGTTGWGDQLAQLRARCESGNGTMMWSSNYSIGVNLFMRLNKYLASLMAGFSQYTPFLHEVHHIHKLDHPSGTAITLAEGIIDNDPAVKSWGEEPVKDDPASMVVSHERRGEVPGIHTITWDSPVDSIAITHSAKSRQGFALGAVMAAEWLAGKTGYHTIDQFINDIINDSRK